MELTVILLVILGVALGVVIGYLLGKSSANLSGSNENRVVLQQQLHLEKEKNQSLQQQLGTIDAEIKANREQYVLITREKATLEANFSHIQEKLLEQKKEVVALQDQFALQFKNLAHEIFEEKSKKFTDQNKLNLTQLLDPLKEKITVFEKRVEDTAKENIKLNATMSQEIKNLLVLNQQITKEAESLTRALKGDNKSQGSWGEIQLESILEKAGLQKDIHYFKEMNFKGEDGSNQRPDYVLKLPDNKFLVLDSKVSLTAYTNYFNSTEEIDLQRHLKLHLESIHSHIKILGDKNYQNLYGITQPDYVLLFVANEPALNIALKEDNSLFEKALARNLVLVSTSTLLATLRTISYIWKQDLQNKNAEEIARRAGDLYDKFEGFVQDLIKVGNSIKQSKDNYDLAMNKLVEGKGNLVKRAEQLKELGAKATKQLDQRLLDRASD